MQDVGGDNWRRADMLKHWSRYGGVMIVGYSMYRNLSQCYRVRSKHQKKIFQEALVDPGEKSSIITYFPLFSRLEDLLLHFLHHTLGSSDWSYFTICTPYISGIGFFAYENITTIIETIKLMAQVFRKMFNFTPGLSKGVNKILVFRNVQVNPVKRVKPLCEG